MQFDEFIEELKKTFEPKIMLTDEQCKEIIHKIREEASKVDAKNHNK